MTTMFVANVETERVIIEVRGQPSLWDHSDILYKDRNAKLQAWMEICRALFPGYDDLPYLEKKEIEKNVHLRWRTARDAYLKCKNALKKLKSRPGGGKKQKYVYFEQMQFLDKRYVVDTVDSINKSQKTSKTCNVSPPSQSSKDNQSQFPSTSRDVGNSSNSTAVTLNSPTTIPPNQTKVQKNAQKRKKDAGFDKEMLKFFKESSEMMKNDDMAFFYSLLPVTKSFDIRQKLLFRSEILRKAMEISNNTTAGFPSMHDNHNYFSSRPESSTSRPRSSTSPCTSYIIPSPASEEKVSIYVVEESASQAQDEQQY